MKNFNEERGNSMQSLLRGNVFMKKRITLVLVITMIMTLLGSLSFICAEASANPNIIAEYDFDDYSDLNGFITANGDNWKFGLAANTAATVETDVVSGSKALKFTSPNNQTSDSNITYVFDSALTTGTTKISFDMRFANHSIQISRLGQLFENSGFSGGIPVLSKRVGEVLSTITTGIRSTSTTHWVNTNANADKYYTIEQIWNADTKTLTYNIIKDGTVVGTGTKTGGETAGFASVGLMSFVFKSVSGSNGTATGNAVYYIDNFKISNPAPIITSVLPQNNAIGVSISQNSVMADIDTKLVSNTVTTDTVLVYKDDVLMPSGSYSVAYQDIDNHGRITVTFSDALNYGTAYKVKFTTSVKSVKNTYMEDNVCKFFTMESPNTIARINFDGMSIGSIAASNAVSGGTITMNSVTDNKAEIAVDPVSQSRALKLTKTSSGTVLNLIYALTNQITSGKTQISYDVRIDSATRCFSYIGSVQNSAYLPLSSPSIFGTGLWGVFTLDNNKYLTNYRNNIEKNYAHFEQVVDLDKKTVKITVTNKADASKTFTTTLVHSYDNVKFLRFYTSKPSDAAANAWEYDSAADTAGTLPDAVMYVDNIVIEKGAPEVASISPSNNETDIAISNKTVIADIDAKLLASTVTTDSVEVYENDTLLSDTSYSVVYQDLDENSGRITIRFANDLNYSATYKIKFTSALETSSGLKMQNEIYKFTTIINPDSIFDFKVVNANDVEVSELSEFAGSMVTAKATVNYVTDYTFIVSLTDAAGKLVSVNLADNTEFVDNAIEVEISIPSEATNEFQITGFLWGGLNSMNPLSKKKCFDQSAMKVYVDASTVADGDGSIEEPFRTLTEARDYVRIAKLSGVKSEIILRGGTYALNETFALNSEDNDTTYRIYGNEKAKIKTAPKLSLSDFNPVGNGIYKVKLTDKGITDTPEYCITGHSQYYLNQAGIPSGGTTSTLYFNDEMMTIARYPNTGYMTVNSVVQNSNLETKTPMVFTVSDSRTSNWANADDAWMCGYWYYDWSDQTTRIASVNTATSTITSAVPSAFGVRAGQRFFIYNLLEELDAPGEWFYDKDTGELYIYPIDENADSAITFGFNSSDLISVSNADNISFCGLDFVDSAKNGIIMTDTTNSTIKNCSFENIGANGIYISGGANAVVSHNLLNNLGAGGIIVYGGNLSTLKGSGHIVRYNEISNYGKHVKTYAPGILIDGVGSSTISNKIYNAPHCGIIFRGNDHVISNNEIYNVLLETADSGAIYTGRSSVSRGTVLTGNYIHNIASNSTYGGQYGIYLDDCFSGTEIINNSFENITGSGTFINGGRNNTVCDNTFIGISEKPIILSAAGRTTWYGTDSEFEEMIGLTTGIHLTTPYGKYTNLYNILNDAPRNPKYNIILRNTFNSCSDTIYINTYDTDITTEEIEQMNTISE